MPKTLKIWLLNDNRWLYLNTDNMVVHDGDNHPLYHYDNGKLRALSGTGFLTVEPDGRILDKAGIQIGFVNDYPNFLKDLSRYAGGTDVNSDSSHIQMETAGGSKPVNNEKKLRKSRNRFGKLRAALTIIAFIIFVCIFVSGTRDEKAFRQGLIYEDVQAAGVRLRQAFINHEEELEIRYHTDTLPGVDFTFARSELNKVAYQHTGDPNGGDALALTAYIDSMEGSYEKANKGYDVTLKLGIAYFTTKEQEEQLRNRIRSVVSSLNLAGKSDYEKTLAIYRWICDHVTYDHAHLNDESYLLQYTAYNAAVIGTAVCSGYAQLFYRMALTAGLEARIKVNNNHAWNLVKLGSKYYYCDSTWDRREATSTYQYFLRGKYDFGEHYEGTFKWWEIYDSDVLKNFDLYLPVSDYAYNGI